MNNNIQMLIFILVVLLIAVILIFILLPDPIHITHTANVEYWSIYFNISFNGS